ncbi:hypothetical protein, partial [Clostridium perfringens]|uniref:hypothetical protein n=1 Tax=Clostridium perfringens TaxID=1502 RepID=UPI001FB065DC
ILSKSSNGIGTETILLVIFLVLIINFIISSSFINEFDNIEQILLISFLNLLISLPLTTLTSIFLSV